MESASLLNLRRLLKAAEVKSKPFSTLPITYSEFWSWSVKIRSPLSRWSPSRSGWRRLMRRKPSQVLVSLLTIAEMGSRNLVATGIPIVSNWESVAIFLVFSCPGSRGRSG